MKCLSDENYLLFVQRMKAILDNPQDCELDHLDADSILMDLLMSMGMKELDDCYSDIDKWFS